MKPTTGLSGVILLAGMLFTTVLGAQTEPVRPTVIYDSKTDGLSVTASNASYKETMALVATRSGIEILMDPKAEHNITVTLKDTPLEKALSELSRQTNFAFFYSAPVVTGNAGKSAPAKPVLTSMQILPKGEAGSNQLMPLLAPDGEAFIREKDRNLSATQAPKIFSYAQQRWEARLKLMKPEHRERLLANAKEKNEMIEKRQEEKEKRRQEHAKIRKEHEQKRLADLEQLKISNPEMYERRMKLEAEKRRNPPPEQ